MKAWFQVTVLKWRCRRLLISGWVCWSSMLAAPFGFRIMASLAAQAWTPIWVISTLMFCVCLWLRAPQLSMNP